MRRQINSKLFLRIFILFLGISICVRSFYFRIYGNHKIEFALLFSLLIINIFLYLLYNRKIKLTVPFLLSILVLFNFIGVDSVSKINLFFYIICIGVFICITDRSDIFIMLVKIIVIFAIVTATVTWISYFFPNFYIYNIINIFSNESKSEVIRYFIVNGHYMGLTNHYSRNAFYIVAALIFLTPFVLSKLNKGIYIIVYIYLILTLLLIGKRGHGLFFVLSFCIMILFNYKSKRKRIKSIIKWIFISIIIFTLIILFIPQVNTLFIRLTTVSDDVTSGRDGLYKIAFDMFKRSPIIGNGYGSFAREVNFTFAGVHNDYLQILAENGLIGFTIMLGFNLYCYIYSIKAIRITNYENNYAKMSFMFQTFILLYSFTGLPRYDYEVMTLYLIMCIWGVEIFSSNYRRKGK